MVAAILLEEFTLKHNTVTHTIVYEDLELIKNGKKQKLINAVSELTGKDIIRVKIRNVDYRKKVAELEISYRD
jgi:hypothetical protein